MGFLSGAIRIVSDAVQNVSDAICVVLDGLQNVSDDVQIVSRAVGKGSVHLHAPSGNVGVFPSGVDDTPGGVRLAWNVLHPAPVVIGNDRDGDGSS